MRLELTRPCDHYPLKVACIPISPPALVAVRSDSDWLFRFRYGVIIVLATAPLKIQTLFRFEFCYIITSIIVVPRTGLEPARLSTYAPETYASTNSATWAKIARIAILHFLTVESVRILLFLADESARLREKKQNARSALQLLSGKRDSNSRPRPWQGRALPTELLPQNANAKVRLF